MFNINQSEEQRKNFEIALKNGSLRDLAIARGGTGELRKELSSKEKAKRKTRRNMVKMSRKRNR